MRTQKVVKHLTVLKNVFYSQILGTTLALEACSLKIPFFIYLRNVKRHFDLIITKGLFLNHVIGQKLAII
jgi:hypothetical protein